MSALICGSFAYDTIMVFHDKFKNHILPDKVHILNVAFHVPEMRREFGGCAGNIAYNLKLLGGDPLPMGTIGNDFGPYAEWMDACGVPRTHLKVIDETYTAQAFITTDMDDNQIIAFHPGAMDFAHHNQVGDAEDIRIGMVSPDGRDGMIEHATQFAEAGIPFIFDPGQGLPLFGGEDLKTFIDQASYVCVNDYEAELLQERTGLSPHEIAERVEALIITRGARGSEIYLPQHRIDIPAAPARELADPTGCGDAYRAGLLYGLMHDLDWEVTGRIAALMGAIKIESHGTQNHRFDRAGFEARYKESFGHALAW
ncbi:carbohydrate kinase family protein [Thiohalobacter sp. IOR34]|uniref:carbohydrate kinase family protein n=1 Tax=Thiohalobacter sp. IOR34 TaxID=3057176 RepID=UPI0025B0AB8B|nr:carbohydrate kinase family protein [Thiohalobacter sp. IOR34]WJW75884.1 carbohydrate kinase family protein [Thiohalobacter sp. IOR34]